MEEHHLWVRARFTHIELKFDVAVAEVLCHHNKTDRTKK